MKKQSIWVFQWRKSVHYWWSYILFSPECKELTSMLDPLLYRWGVPPVVIRCVHWTMQMWVLQTWIKALGLYIVMECRIRTHTLIHTYIHAHTYMFVVNFDALTQTSDFRIERRQFVFLCWMQDSTQGLWNWISSRLNARCQTDSHTHTYIFVGLILMLWHRETHINPQRNR